MSSVDLLDAIKNSDILFISQFIRDNNLEIKDGRLVPKEEAVSDIKEKEIFWNQRQQARKILLNSLYGALLNEALRFHSEAMGQSVTLTGRSITKHMNAKVNEIITGEYDHTGAAIIAVDTDSCYFSVVPVFGDNFVDDKDVVIEVYDSIADTANDSFPEFMSRTFNTSLQRGRIIAAGRELIASTALFIKKKKYACLIYDLEGTRQDINGSPGKLKVMGLEIKRADTPEAMQSFLKSILMDVLLGESERHVINRIAEFRKEFSNWKPWEKGSPKKVSNLSKYKDMKQSLSEVSLWKKKVTPKSTMIPGHVDASINWNTLLSINNDKYSMRITDGSRIIVCKLKSNHLQMKAVAYPVDEPHIPEWFKKLPFDDKAMEEVIIDKKINNLLSVLNWDLKSTKQDEADLFFQW